ncbi:MAG TPA: CheR family methyltransferase [Solirubrobacterales bacterium]|jgi:two-component system CheB/CheR fusion protein|nr:CheR family methyltransferase [Solirubrobacterales bacterium]
MSPAKDKPAEESAALEALLDYLRDSRGFDFTGYKRATLERRIRKRIGEVGLDNYEDYVGHLEANPREFSELFNTILINVTGFFRDPEAWDYLLEDILPELVERVPDDEQIRVWSAGCASGQEAYTAAICLLEVLGEETFRRRVKIYATDIDEEALAEARSAIYPPKALEDMPKELADKYFVENGRGFGFRADLRRSVIFGRNELLQDAPISRIDLLICRNVLMYFTVEAQTRILSQLNFALRDRGYLFLGKSEMLVRHSDFFTPVDIKRRIFHRIPRRNVGERVQAIGDAAFGDDSMNRRHADLREAAASVGPVARLVVDAQRFLVDANIRAIELFAIGPADLGRPLQDLEVSYRPLDLRSPLDRAFEGGLPVGAGRVDWGENGSERILEVEITPIAGVGQPPTGAAITFADVTEFARLATDHGNSKRELETAYEELQSTVEELETTNEELQSTNEELETTNEELQSANEELQTMNEELTSTNDELEAMNDEQLRHTEELDRLNLFLEGILGNLGVGVVVVDRENKVQLWNANSHDLWGLRPDEVEGVDLLTLDIGLPVAELAEPLDDAVSAGAKSTDLLLDAVNRRGRAFKCEVRVMPLFSASQGLFGGIVLMREVGGLGTA